MTKLHTQAFKIRFYRKRKGVLLGSDVCQDICFIGGGELIFPTEQGKFSFVKGFRCFPVTQVAVTDAQLDAGKVAAAVRLSRWSSPKPRRTSGRPDGFI